METLLARPRLALVAYCLLCWLPGWFTIPVTDRDEARFAQATKQMIETGDVVAIRNGTEARNRKPIGIHWLQLPGVALARTLHLARENPVWPYRLPSLLGALLAVLATHRLGRRLLNPEQAWLAAAMLGGCVLLTVEAHLAKTDAALLAATTVAMVVLGRLFVGERVGRGEAALFWVAIGLGTLIKGPITPMVVALTAVVLAARQRRLAWLGALRPAWGVPLALLIVLPWLVAIERATGGAFLRDAVGHDLGGKLAGGAESHGAPPGTHLALLPLTLAPAGFAAIRAVPAIWARRREKAVGFLLAWLVPSWLVFEAVPTKLPHYILPLLPPLCLLAASALDAPVPRAARVIGDALGWLAALVLLAGSIALPVLSGWPWWQVVLASSAVAGALAAPWLARLRAPSRLTVAVLAMPVVYGVVLGVMVPGAAPLWLSPRLADAAAGAPLAVVGDAEPSVMFMAGTDTLFLSPQAAAAWLGPGRVVAVEARALAEFRALRPDAVAAGTLSGLNYSNGHRMSVVLFRAARGSP